MVKVWFWFRKLELVIQSGKKSVVTGNRGFDVLQLSEKHNKKTCVYLRLLLIYHEHLCNHCILYAVYFSRFSAFI